MLNAFKPLTINFSLLFFISLTSVQGSELIRQDSSDFDFLVGSWEVTNKIRTARLADNNEWQESKAHSVCRKLMDGFANMDEFKMKSRNGKLFKGISIRTYDPKSDIWTIYWADVWNLNLGVTKQTTGSFKNGEGTFFGEEKFNGKMVKIKFTWKVIDQNTAYWDQAYFDEKNQDWEINWIMNFKRIYE